MLLVRGAKQLLTLHGANGARRGSAMRELGIIADGAVLMENGAIVEVGPSRRVENLVTARSAEVIDATGRVVLPGFVDSHTHLVHGGAYFTNGAPPNAAEALRAGIQAIHTVSARRLELRAETIAATMARHGTTTVEAKTGFGGGQTGEMKILRVLARLNGRPLDIVPTVAIPAGDPAAWLQKVARRKLAVFAGTSLLDSPGEPGAAARLRVARQFGFPLKAQGFPALAIESGAVSVDLAGDVTEEEVRALAESQTIATVLPGPAFQTATGAYPPGRRLVDAGAAVALATAFNPHLSPTCSMQMVIALACSRLGLTPAEAICAATINGAHALGIGARIGSLEPGKQADLLVLNVSDYREIGHWFGINLVQTTIKKGLVIHSECRTG